MSSDIEQKVIDVFTKKLVAEVDDSIANSITGNVWVPQESRKRYYRDQWRRELYQDWDDISKQAADPVQRLRDEVREELRDIKKAVNKMGIMLDSEAPSEEQLRKSKTLKDAYLKYKMVEKLVLGEEAK